jgi:hypothetical protein
MNGQILGLSREEIQDKFQAIEAFADIGDFIDHAKALALLLANDGLREGFVRSWPSPAQRRRCWDVLENRSCSAQGETASFEKRGQAVLTSLSRSG